MAIYYMSARKGVGKKSEKPYWCIDVLRYISAFGSWVIKPVYCSEDMFYKVCNEEFPVGYPVCITVGLDGELTDIKPADGIEPLELQP